MTPTAPALVPAAELPRAPRRRRSLHRRLFALALALGAVASPALARDTYLAVEPMAGKKVRMDGVLRDWPSGFVELSQSVRGSGTRSSALVGYDAQYLYLALKTDDSAIARTASAGKNEDHLSLVLFTPSLSGGRGAQHVIDVFPGQPGKLPGVVKVDGRAVSGAQAVEAPNAKGYELEARLPWSAVPEASQLRMGLRGALEYTDASAPGRVRSVSASTTARGAAMPPLTLEAETGLMQALIEPRGLSPTPAREVFGDVAGGPLVERVALYDHYLSVLGPDYLGGKQFYFNELDVPNANSIVRLELLDVDGDAKHEILLEKRLGKPSEYRQVLQILKIGRDNAPLQVFAHETAIKTPDGFLENEVKISGSGKSARVRIAQGKAEGFEPGTYREPTLQGVTSALLPWQSVGAQTYAWKGAGLALESEEAWTPKRSGSAPSAASAPQVKAPPPPRPPSADELLDRVYALYRNDRGVGQAPPRFDFVTDVVEGEQPERVLVHGKDLVVFGKGFKQGLSYAFITVGVKEPSDILDVTARDLTGDGKAEIVLRGRLDAQASKELGGDVVRRDALYVYKVLGDRLVRIFAAETGRALGEQRILGSVAFLPAARGVNIQLRPGRAVGWTERTYPFPEDQHPAGGLEPLLLPWGSQRERSYTFTADAFQLQP